VPEHGAKRLMSGHRDYVPELERARASRDASLQALKDDSMNRLMKDLSVDRQDPEFRQHDRWEMEEDEEDEDDGGEATIIDRSEFLPVLSLMKLC
jgi:GPN-loop GTPase